VLSEILCIFAAENDTRRMKFPRISLVLVLWTLTSNLLGAEPLRLLGIGNSFTENMLQQLPFLLPERGSGALDVAYLYRAGATMDNYCQMMKNDRRQCDLYEFDPECGEWNVTEGVLVDSVLTMKQWDVITLQQASSVSGLYNTIEPNLEVILDSIEHYQPQAMIAWHMTWSYSRNSKHPDFSVYDFSQLKMDYAIEQTTMELKEDFADRIDMIIPSQQLLKRLRQSELNDSLDLTRDGYHLSDFAAEAVSDLVYEMLLAPRLGVSVIENPYEAVIDSLHAPTDFKYIKQTAYDVCHDSLIWENLSENIIYKTEYYTLMGMRLWKPVYSRPIIRRNIFLSGDKKDEKVMLIE